MAIPILGALGGALRPLGAFARGVAGVIAPGGSRREVSYGQQAPIDPRDPQFTSANAPRVQQDAQGQWTLTEHGNTRVLQPNEVADAQGYANQFWQDNPTGFQMNNPQTIPDAYQQFLGRAPDAAGLAAHQANPGGMAAAVDAIRRSQEAQGRRMAPAPGLGAYGQPAGGIPPWMRDPNPVYDPSMGTDQGGWGGSAPSGSADIPTTRREGEWDITSGGFTGSQRRVNIRTGETQYLDKRTGQWVTDGATAAAIPGLQPLGAFGRGY